MYLYAKFCNHVHWSSLLMYIYLIISLFCRQNGLFHVKCSINKINPRHPPTSCEEITLARGCVTICWLTPPEGVRTDVPPQRTCRTIPPKYTLSNRALPYTSNITCFVLLLSIQIVPPQNEFLQTHPLVCQSTMGSFTDQCSFTGSKNIGHMCLMISLAMKMLLKDLSISVLMEIFQTLFWLDHQELAKQQ